MRVRYGRALAVLSALLLVSGCLSSSSTKDPRRQPVRAPAIRPNFVFVITDDLDETLLPYMPKLRKLVTDQGTSLSRYYVNLSWCCPSRSTILRGQYAHNTGVWSNTTPNGGFAEFHKRGEEYSTLASWLHGAGYRTGLFGKYLNGYPEQVPSLGKAYVPPGWDSWVSPVAGHPFLGFDYTLNVNGRLVHRKPAPSTYLTDVLSRESRTFVTAPDKRPFFTYIAPVTPHAPAVPAPRHRGLYPKLKAPRTPAYDLKDMTGKPVEMRRLPRVTAGEERQWDDLFRKRVRSAVSIDDMVGDLVQSLTASGRLANTYFIFTSDNGFHIGDYRMGPGKNTGYEGDIRVPFIVRGPGVPAGRTVATLAGNTDVAPTLTDLAGVTAAPFVDGRSLRPLLAGKQPATWRRAFLLEHGTARGTFPAGPGDKPKPYTPKTRAKVYLPVFAGLRTDRYLYLEYVTGERELYDLQTDPYQLHNRAADPLAASLSGWLARLRYCAGQACRAAESSGP